jgi:hypothetical protein
MYRHDSAYFADSLVINEARFDGILVSIGVDRITRFDFMAFLDELTKRESAVGGLSIAAIAAQKLTYQQVMEIPFILGASEEPSIRLGERVKPALEGKAGRKVFGGIVSAVAIYEWYRSYQSAHVTVRIKDLLDQ